MFGVVPGNGSHVLDRQGETRPGPRYEETDSEDVLRNGNTPDFGKRSLSILDDHTGSGGPQPTRRPGDDDDVR